MITICGISALEYWINGTNRNYPSTFTYSKARSGKELAAANLDPLFQFAGENCLSYPLHIMVPKEKLYLTNSFVKCHLQPEYLPEKSMVRMADKICMSSPELTFLMISNSYHTVVLARIACDLCGGFVRDSSEKFQQRFRIPITNIDSINNYLNASMSVNGIRNARKAIRYAADNSNSPMESCLCVCANVPLNAGGYAAAGFEMNGDAILSNEGTRIFGNDTCCADLLWRSDKVVMEYDSNTVHLDEDQMNWDKKKSSALSASGYIVINVTRRDMKDIDKLDAKFLAVRKALGLKMRTVPWDAFKDKRKETQELLLHSDR